MEHVHMFYLLTHAMRGGKVAPASEPRCSPLAINRLRIITVVDAISNIIFTKMFQGRKHECSLNHAFPCHTLARFLDGRFVHVRTRVAIIVNIATASVPSRSLLSFASTQGLFFVPCDIVRIQMITHRYRDEVHLHWARSLGKVNATLSPTAFASLRVV